MQIDNYLIRNMKEEETVIAIDWASKEGWNPGVYDLKAFYKTDPTGWWIGLLKDEPISVITAIKYKSGFSFVGFYVVKPEFRGKGYGIKLWNKAIESLNGMICGLDGVVDQQENYKKSGFVYAHRNIRYKAHGIKDLNTNTNIFDISLISFPNLIKYDLECFPSPRPEFLGEWIKSPESFTHGFLQNNLLKGYGTIRRCEEGFKIGPLFADSETIAEELL
nr:GNAT family N-acetyltransferase [Melioribacteraceae bacterium]